MNQIAIWTSTICEYLSSKTLLLKPEVFMFCVSVRMSTTVSSTTHILKHCLIGCCTGLFQWVPLCARTHTHIRVCQRRLQDCVLQAETIVKRSGIEWQTVEPSAAGTQRDVTNSSCSTRVT